jgi:hypothetical protein
VGRDCSSSLQVARGLRPQAASGARFWHPPEPRRSGTVTLGTDLPVSTGSSRPEVYGAGEWLADKPGRRSAGQYRKGGAFGNRLMRSRTAPVLGSGESILRVQDTKWPKPRTARNHARHPCWPACAAMLGWMLANDRHSTIACGRFPTEKTRAHSCVCVLGSRSLAPTPVAAGARRIMGLRVPSPRLQPRRP